MKKSFNFILFALYLLLLTPITVNAATLIFQAGEIDNFQEPFDQAIPDPRLLEIVGYPDLLWFDQIPGLNGPADTSLIHTFINLKGENSSYVKIIGGTLEISVKAGTEDVVDQSLATDGFKLVTLDLDNPSFDSRIEIGRDFGKVKPGDCGSDSDDPGFLQSTTWSPGDSAVFTLDLSAIPLKDGGTFDLIPYIDEYNLLNVIIEDETGTDYMLLNIETAEVPIPAALWLLGAGFIGLFCVRRKFNKAY